MKIKKKLLTLFSCCVFIALMLFNVSVSMEDTGTIADVSLSGISALASCEYHENGCDPGGGQDCTSFGFREWDHPLSFKDGYDCLCVSRDKVKNDCN